MLAFEYIDHIFRGIITGFFIAYLIILGLRPAVMYPDDILEIIDNPWVFLVLLVMNYYVFLWDDTIGMLMLLTLTALLLDIVLFTEGGFIKENVEIFSNKNTEIVEKISYVSPPNENSRTYKDINDMILNKLKQLRLENMESANSPAPFI